MKPPALAFLLVVEVAAAANGLEQTYAPLGRLMVTQFASAPFPHPQRAAGHRYKEQHYPADKHYSDSPVAVFIPQGLRPTGRIDCVIHFHGWNNHVANVLRQFQLIEQLMASGKNAVLVVPQGPRNAPDSFGGKLEDLNGFSRFAKELRAVLAESGALGRKNAEFGKIILSGHSGGSRVMAAILDRGGPAANAVAEVWLFDALYAETKKFLAWWDQRHGRLLNIYTEQGGTKDDTLEFMNRLKGRGTPFFAASDPEATPRDLQTHRLIFLSTDLGHNEVVAQRQTFRTFLQTSGLADRSGDSPAKKSGALGLRAPDQG